MKAAANTKISTTSPTINCPAQAYPPSRAEMALAAPISRSTTAVATAATAANSPTIPNAPYRIADRTESFSASMRVAIR